MICLNSAETLYISLRFIQTSPLMSCSEDEDNIKRIFINLVPQINCIQSLEQIIQDIHTFVEQNDDELSEDFMINNIGIPEDTRERKCSFDREDFSLTQQQADGGSQILNSLQQETEHDVSIEHDMNNNNNNNKEVHYQKEIIQNEINSLNQLHLNQNNGLEYKMFPEKNNYDEMEKPQSNNDCFCFQKGPYCDSGIFSSSFVNFNDLELKADNISNVSTATPVNSNYNSNNNNNNNNNNNINQYNLTNHFNTLNNHIQTNPSLITTSSSSQQIAQYNSSQSDHFNTNFSDTNFTKYLNENKAKLNIYDNFQSHSNFNSIQQLPTRITLDDDQQFD